VQIKTKEEETEDLDDCSKLKHYNCVCIYIYIYIYIYIFAFLKIMMNVFCGYNITINHG